MTELANGDVSKVFTFYTRTTVANGQLSLTLQAMALVNKQPPTTFSMSGTVGDPLTAFTSGIASGTGSFSSSLGTTVSITFAGAANPITGSDAVISNAGLEGRYATDHFCARLTGHVVQPAAAARDLDPDKNFCIFDSLPEGAAIPTHSFADFAVANCPL